MWIWKGRSIRRPGERDNRAVSPVVKNSSLVQNTLGPYLVTMHTAAREDGKPPARHEKSYGTVLPMLMREATNRNVCRGA